MRVWGAGGGCVGLYMRVYTLGIKLANYAEGTSYYFSVQNVENQLNLTDF